jgi:hypothetical protein
MNKRELATIVDTIKGIYGNRFEINPNTYEIWFDMLAPYPFEPMIEYVKHGSIEQDFPPTLADLIRSAGGTQSQRYHQMLRDNAQERFRQLDEWQTNFTPRTDEQKARLDALVNRIKSSAQP